MEMNRLSASASVVSACITAAACSSRSTSPFATPGSAGDLDAATAAVEGGLDADIDAAQPDASGDALGGWHPGSGDGGNDGSTTVVDGGAPAVDTVTESIGPISVAAGEETTVCITMRMSNAQAVYVPRIRVQLAPGSHHLVVYRSKATSESLTPTSCTAFQGILSGAAVPLMISEKPSDELTFPQGVALKFAPQQMIELEAHYIDSTTSALQGRGTVLFDTIPVITSNVIESDLAFWGTLGIALAGGVQSVGPLFAAGLAGTHGFALTTHQHRLGTEFKIWAANSAQDTNHAPIADTTDWANPPLYRLNPEIDFGGQNGLAYQCTWNNTTGQAVTFGESALQEMCFLWMYYYPTQGFDMRFQ
jgi:hypothetical protein